MALAALPVELIDAVLAPLAHNHSALDAAALTCTALNPSATRLLYRHLSLSAYARNLSLIHLLATHPHLASLVRSFYVLLGDAEPAVVPTYSDLQHALRLMTNLSSIALYVDASTSWILSPPQGESGQKSSEILSPGSAFYPRLEHLTCNFPLDAHLSSFLGQVPSLISLTLSSVSSVHPEFEPEHDAAAAHANATPEHVCIPPSHIPLLEAYTGPAYLLPTLASRPLKAVHLSGDLTLDLLPGHPMGASDEDEAMAHLQELSLGADSARISSANSLSASAAEMQVMSAMTSAPPAQLLETLAIAFPNLVCLRLMTTRALWDLPDLAFYSRIASTLSGMSSLAAFELAGIHWQSRAKPSSSSVKSEEMEWITPPVSPRVAEAADDEDGDDELVDRDYDFDGAFLDWSY